MYGRSPRYLEENALSAELKRMFDAGDTQILKPARYIRLYAPKSVPVSGQITMWTPHEFSYPAVIKPAGQLTATHGGAPSGKLFAFLGEAPELAPEGGVPAIESRGGLLRIPFPGKWWIGYDGPVDTSVLAIVFDDTCGAAQHLLSRRNVIMREPGAVNVLAAAATNIITADQYRDGVLVQNIGNVDVWIRHGTAAGAPAAVGTGYRVPPGETYPLVGDLAYKGDLNGRADGANCPVWPVEVLS